MRPAEGADLAHQIFEHFIFAHGRADARVSCKRCCIRQLALPFGLEGLGERVSLFQVAEIFRRACRGVEILQFPGGQIAQFHRIRATRRGGKGDA